MIRTIGLLGLLAFAGAGHAQLLNDAPDVRDAIQRDLPDVSQAIQRDLPDLYSPPSEHNYLSPNYPTTAPAAQVRPAQALRDNSFEAELDCVFSMPWRDA